MEEPQPTIYYLKNDDILNDDILYNYIYPNMNLNYFWSDDFDEEFYINCAYAGFITVSNTIDEKFILLPELQFEYAISDFNDLHISKKVKQLLKKDEYKLSINTDLECLLSQMATYHDNCWITNKYLDLIKRLNSYQHKSIDFKLLCVELKCTKTNTLIAGELGYTIGSTYTSLSGFCSKDKQYRNWGTLQLVLLSSYLKKNNYAFWNLGHASMQYKLNIGAKVYKREDFLNRWIKARQNKS